MHTSTTFAIAVKLFIDDSPFVLYFSQVLGASCKADDYGADDCAHGMKCVDQGEDSVCV